MDFRISQCAWVLLIPILFGCSHTRVKPLPPLTVGQFLEDQRSQEKTLAQAVGNVRLGVKTKEIDVSGKGKIVSEIRGPLRMEIRDMLGRTQYVATLDGAAFTAYYPTQQLAYRDDAAGRYYLKKMVGLELGFSDLQYLAMGVLPPEYRACRPLSRDEVQGVYRTHCGPATRPWMVTVDPFQRTLSEITVPSGRILFQDVSKEGNIALAHRVELKGSQGTLSIDWSQVNFGADRFPKLTPFALPPGVQRIFLTKAD